MLFTTKHKMAAASTVYSLLSKFRKMFYLDDHTKVIRNGINWDLDLREGLDLVIFFTGGFQKQVSEACIRLMPPGGVAIDIGANMGSVTLPLWKSITMNGCEGKIYAIEPTTYPLERLKKNILVNKIDVNMVTALQIFLTNSLDESPPSYVQSSWNVSGNKAGAHPIHLAIPQSTEGAVSTTLDLFIASQNLSKLDLIKIDVDGAEDDIIASGTNSILAFKPSIVIEVAPYSSIERNLKPLAPLDRLKKLDYKFITMNGKLMTNHDLDKLLLLKDGQSIDIVAVHSDNLDSAVKKLL